MWANAQRDGRPAEYRWRPLFNAAVWLTPTTAHCDFTFCAIQILLLTYLLTY